MAVRCAGRRRVRTPEMHLRAARHDLVVLKVGLALEGAQPDAVEHGGVALAGPRAPAVVREEVRLAVVLAHRRQQLAQRLRNRRPPQLSRRRHLHPNLLARGDRVAREPRGRELLPLDPVETAVILAVLGAQRRGDAVEGHLAPLQERRGEVHHLARVRGALRSSLVGLLEEVAAIPTRAVDGGWISL